MGNDRAAMRLAGECSPKCRGAESGRGEPVGTDRLSIALNAAVRLAAVFNETQGWQRRHRVPPSDCGSGEGPRAAVTLPKE